MFQVQIIQLSSLQEVLVDSRKYYNLISSQYKVTINYDNGQKSRIVYFPVALNLVTARFFFDCVPLDFLDIVQIHILYRVRVLSAPDPKENQKKSNKLTNFISSLTILPQVYFSKATRSQSFLLLPVTDLLQLCCHYLALH